MNPGEDHCYSEQVKNLEDSGSEKDSVHTRPSLAPLRSDRSEVNKTSKSDCEDDIELNLSLRSSQSEEEDLEGIIDSLLEMNPPQVIEEEEPDKMATINTVTTRP